MGRWMGVLLRVLLCHEQNKMEELAIPNASYLLVLLMREVSQKQRAISDDKVTAEEKLPPGPMHTVPIHPPVEWSGPATAGLGTHAVGASAGFQEVQHHRQSAVCGVCSTRMKQWTKIAKSIHSTNGSPT